MTMTVEVIRKSITVEAEPERAFRLFTEGISRWWPLETHSVHAHETEAVVLEPQVGGRFYERSASGGTAAWGEVLECDPPRLVRFTWHPGYESGAPATEVEVRFRPDGDGTRVELEHRGWERLPDAGRAMERSYDEGWDYVLGRFAAHVSS
jgi:uncharacterized protein YndB with AHSA1/START domain